MIINQRGQKELIDSVGDMSVMVITTQHGMVRVRMKRVEMGWEL